MQESGEKKIIFKEGDQIRVLRGKIVKEDDIFIWIHRRDMDFRINKTFIIKIEAVNHEKQ